MNIIIQLPSLAYQVWTVTPDTYRPQYFLRLGPTNLADVSINDLSGNPFLSTVKLVAWMVANP